MVGDLYRHYPVMQAGWNVVKCCYSACFFLLQREKKVSQDTCVAGVATQSRQTGTGGAFFCASCHSNVKPRRLRLKTFFSKKKNNNNRRPLQPTWLETQKRCCAWEVGLLQAHARFPLRPWFTSVSCRGTWWALRREVGQEGSTRSLSSVQSCCYNESLKSSSMHKTSHLSARARNRTSLFKILKHSVVDQWKALVSMCHMSRAKSATWSTRAVYNKAVSRSWRSSSSMTLLVAQSAVFEFLSCAQTTRAIFSHAGVYFFLRRSTHACVARLLRPP